MIKFNIIPPIKEWLCDLDGTELIVREDDREEKVLERLNVYQTETFPLVEYYERKNILSRIDANGKIEEISEKILKELS